MHKNKSAGREIWTLLLKIHVKTLRFTHFTAIHFYKNLSYFLLIHSLGIRFSVKETSPCARDFEYSINLVKMNKNKNVGREFWTLLLQIDVKSLFITFINFWTKFLTSISKQLIREVSKWTGPDLWLNLFLLC